MRLTARQLLLVTALVAAPAGLRAASTQPSLRYIASKSGSFFLAPGWAIKTKYTIRISAMDGCQCRVSCLKNGECKAWSLSKHQNRTECRMANRGPLRSKLDADSRSTYFYLEHSVNGQYVFGEDNLLYLLPSRMHGTFYSAVYSCGQIPGHRLGIFRKVEQLEALEGLLYGKVIENVNRVFYIDLRNSSRGPAFGDGTLLCDTEMRQLEVVNASAGQVFVHWNNSFVGVSSDSFRQFVCQANPLGVEW